jgi:hypothetical protein
MSDPYTTQQLAEEEKASIRKAMENQREFKRQSQNMIWRNPIQEKSAQELRGEYNSNEKDSSGSCSFFLKTGSCKYGEACSKFHPYPSVSTTLVLKNMYDGPGLGEFREDEENDDDLELEEEEIMKGYREFFNDIVPVFKAYGKLEMLRVCRNRSHHLKGNTYAMYSSEIEAKRAYDSLRTRFYAGKKLLVQFCPLVNWQSAVCALFAKGQCDRGKACNFLHVFQNPGGVLEGSFHTENRTNRGLGSKQHEERRTNDRRDRDERRDNNDRREPERDDRRSFSDRRGESRREEYQPRRYDEHRRDDRRTDDRRDRDERRDRDDKRDDRRDDRRLNYDPRERQTENKREAENEDKKRKGEADSGSSNKKRAFRESD